MMKAYFETTNGDNSVILTDGITAKVFNGAPDGTHEGIDLYMTDKDGNINTERIIERLTGHYRWLENCGKLNDYDEIYSANEVEYSDELAKELEENATLFYDSEWYWVHYSGGESRYSEEAADFMIVEVDGIELYAELPPDENDDYATHDELEAEIIEQAEANGIDPAVLKFF